MVELDFSLLPKIVRSRIFLGLPHDIEEEVKALKLPETFDRLRGASRFMGQVSAHQEAWLSRAYLRAGLSEFRSVKEALRWDLPGAKDLYLPGKSQNPLVHLVFRLRRVAVYVQGAQMSEHDTTITVRLFDEDKNYPARLLLIDNVERYLRLENKLLKSYRSQDITHICQWFEENQRQFGASYLLDIGIFIYCKELCKVYSHRNDIV